MKLFAGQVEVIGGARGGRRYHVSRPGDQRHPACSWDRTLTNECEPAQVPLVLRCQRPGCKQLWPPESPRSDGKKPPEAKPAIEVRVAENPERFDPQAGTRILGIDPGFRFVGIGVIVITPTAVRCVHSERFVTKPSDGKPGRRLDMIAVRIHDVISRELPDCVGIENVSNVGHGKGETNAASSEMLKVPGIVRGLAVVYGGVPVFDIATSTARVATFGKGNSRGKTKSDVVTAVQRICGFRRKPNQEVAEAIAVAFGAFRQYHSMR